MTITYRNGVSIAEVAVYIPALAIAIFLAVKHGFGRNSGWYFLIIVALARIIGACLQLATISQPTNIGLYTGSAILNNIGFSPLELACLGFLSRFLDSINKRHATLLRPRMLRLIQIVILVGLILGIIGGIDASDNFQNTGTYQPGSKNEIGTSLLIVSYVAIIISTILISFSLSHAEQGEKRLFVAVVFALPFLLVRLVYSIFSTFTHNRNFNLLTGNVTVLLCVALIPEFICVAMFEFMGLTLRKAVKVEHV